MSQISSFFRSPRGVAASAAKRTLLFPLTRQVPPASLPEAPSPPRLSRRLREETNRAHRLTESTGFVRSLLKGSMDLASFRDMQAGLYLVYSRMETEIARNAWRPLVRMIDFPELRRVDALRRDLSILCGDHWEEQLALTPARERYIERIRWVGAHDPDLLVAHSYTRYLGDLSGGRVVEGIARRTLKIEGSAGLRFFHFPEIPNRKRFKEVYRQRLDEMPLPPHRADAFIAEANHVFALNRAVFEELEGSWLRALHRFVPRRLTDIRKHAK